MTQKFKKERSLQTCQKATQISTSLCFLFRSWSWTAGSCLKSQWEFLKFPPFSKESCPLVETLHVAVDSTCFPKRKKRKAHEKTYVQFDEYKRKPPCKWIRSTCLSLLNCFSSSWLYIPNPSKLLSAHPSIKLEFPGPSLQCTSPISTMRKQLSTSTSSPHECCWVSMTAVVLVARAHPWCYNRGAELLLMLHGRKVSLKIIHFGWNLKQYIKTCTSTLYSL